MVQVPNEQKRDTILRVAAEMFATRPFHKVILAEVASQAGVGKGTLYVYFSSKDDLYRSVVFSGFSDLVDRLQVRLAAEDLVPTEVLELIIRDLVSFAFQNPHIFELMRRVGTAEGEATKWDSKRGELIAMIERAIRRGVAQGAFRDAQPELTARFVPGLVRSVLLGGVPTVDPDTLSRHVMQFVLHGLNAGETTP